MALKLILMGQRYFTFFFLLVTSFVSNAQQGPVEFVQNKGQWKEPFLYKAITPGADLYLERDGFTYVLAAPDNAAKVHAKKLGEIKGDAILNFHAYKVIFEGASPNIKAVGTKLQSHYYNYFLGSDSSRWHGGIHPGHAVDYEGVYPGINMHIASEKEQLKYDFIVQPGADASVIKLRYDGTAGVEVKANNLIINTSVGSVTEQKPYAYQIIEGVRKEVACRYQRSGNVVSYVFPEDYDHYKVLVIDPTVVFATFTGSTADNFGFTATYDNQGNLYAGGFANGAGYPVTTGAFQASFRGGGAGGGNSYAMDIAISKFNSAGNSLVYATYLGGSDNETPHSMIVNSLGELVVAGRTYSSDFPRSSGAYDQSHNGGADIVVTKFNSAGTGIIGSTYIGGAGDDGVNISADWDVVSTLKHNYGDDARSEVIIDNAGNIYVAGVTQSANFPVVNGTGRNAEQDGVVFKFNNNLSSLIWSTHIGGSENDAAYVLALDNTASRVFVSGGTMSSGMGTTGAYRSALQGGIDGFIARFQNGGTYTRERFTYIGTGLYDQCYGIQLDNQNNVYAMGQTMGEFPVFNAAYSNPRAPQFIIKLDNDLSAPFYSTVFGTQGDIDVGCNISPVAFLVDTCQHVYISGWGGATADNGGSTNGMPVNLGTPAPSLLTATTDGSDFYFFVLARNATSQLFGGFYGGQDRSHVDGGTSRFDKNGIVYQAICGGCGGQSNLPMTPGSYSVTNRSSNCNLAALKMAFNFGAASADAKASPDAVLCLGESIQFQNGSANATGYEWNFGDNTTVNNQPSPSHTYTQVGNYTVRLIAINNTPGACKERDTAFLQVSVDTNRVVADFSIEDIQNCPPYRATFVNNSRLSNTPGSATFTRFVWDFGDNTTFNGRNPGVHNYADSGSYTVTLTVIDTTACNSPQTITKVLHLNSDSVKAAFNAPMICVGNEVSFSNTSYKGVRYLWDFGDGDTSTAVNPVHVFDSVKEYRVKLIAYNTTSCNKVDSAVRILAGRPSPIALFTHAPEIPETNVPITFTNTSRGANSFAWTFGDNTGSVEINPPPHQYKRTGKYNVCLAAKNTEGCADTICRDVLADVYPLADIPTGFSPNGDGNNDILYVLGAAIESIDLRIYNRWGTLVFESKSQDHGWDGNYKGKPQEMDAYAYILNVTFIDGTTFSKKGNVTLIR